MTNEREPGPDDDPVLDWALGERLGGERPPDLLASVRSRLAAGDVPVVAARRAASWWAAAAVLLGALVVVGVAAWPHGTPERAPAPAGTQGQEPLVPVQVDVLTDIEKLPATTRAVEVVGGDYVFHQLRRLRDLEVLIVREPWNESFGLSLKTTAPREVSYMTAAIWRTIAGFTKLRRLELRGTVHAGFFGWHVPYTQPPVGWVENLAGGAEDFALLERLPLLEHLTLRCQDTPDELLAALPRLRALRHLDLSFNHGFAEAGFHAILQCRSLRSLSLEGCQQLHWSLLARSSELPELEELNLAHIDRINWRAAAIDVVDDYAVARTLAQRARDLAASGRCGPTDEALAGIAKCPKLRVLDITGGSWSAAGLALLGDVATLKDLRASGGGNQDHSFVAALPQGLERLEVGGDHPDAFCQAVADRLPNLRHLNIAGCSRITDRGLAIVAAMPSLRVLDMRQMRGLTVASIDTLLAAQQLEEIDVRHCDFVTAEHVVRLHRSLPKLRKLETSVDPADIAAAEQLPAALPQVRTVEHIASLPKTTRAIEGIGLDDACMAALAGKRHLEGLSLRPNRAGVMPKGPLPLPPFTPITDAGFRQLANLPALRSLRLDRLREVTPDALAVIAQLPLLQDLHLEVMTLSDEFLASLAALPLPRLAIVGCRGFGGAGVVSIARMSTLRELSLAGCVHLDEDWIAGLAALPQLERLDLSYIGNRTYFSGLSEFGSHVEPGSGVSGRAIGALAKLPTLRELSLAYAAVDAAALRSLQAVPTLRSLDLMGTEVTAADLEALPPSLTRLGLGNCRRLGQDFGTVLAKATPDLHTLVLAHSGELEDACLQSLQAVRSLRALDLSWCGKFTSDAADGLAALTQLEQLTLKDWAVFGTDQWAKVRALPNLKVLETEKVRETLRR